MVSAILDLFALGVLSATAYAHLGPDGYLKRVAKRLGVDVLGAIAEKKSAS